MPAWWCEEGDTPVVAVALHAGHEVRDEVAHLLAVDERGRLVEEDPHTEEWAALSGTRIVACRSRFEVDLNRDRDHAIYRRPEEAWGITVWRNALPDDVVARSMSIYDGFYGALEDLLARVAGRFGRFVLYDLHSYNHRRAGPDLPPSDPAGNPDVNLGTSSVDRDRWGSLLQRLEHDLQAAGCDGRVLDVRENVRFRGGHLCRWVHERFPTSGCAIAIDVKKFFMDEHTGEVDDSSLRGLGAAFAATVPGVIEELQRS
jgi:N-formylglutamate deformylase